MPKPHHFGEKTFLLFHTHLSDVHNILITSINNFSGQKYGLRVFFVHVFAFCSFVGKMLASDTEIHC